MLDSAVLASVAKDVPWGRTFGWIAILMIAVCVGLVIIVFARRAIVSGDEEQETPDGFTLHGLRQLHRQGLISDAEFEQAKATLIERVKARPGADAEDPALQLVQEIHARSSKAGNAKSPKPDVSHDEPAEPK